MYSDGGAGSDNDVFIMTNGIIYGQKYDDESAVPSGKQNGDAVCFTTQAEATSEGVNVADIFRYYDRTPIVNTEYCLKAENGSPVATVAGD